MATATVQSQELKKYPSAQLPRIWTLYYRYGNIPHQQKNFIMLDNNPSMKDAIERAREHCIRMGYRFICVRPFLVDLDEQESRKLSGDIDEKE